VVVADAGGHAGGLGVVFGAVGRLGVAFAFAGLALGLGLLGDLQRLQALALLALEIIVRFAGDGGGLLRRICAFLARIEPGINRIGVRRPAD
jgi:hypothetical protein